MIKIPKSTKILMLGEMTHITKEISEVKNKIIDAYSKQFKIIAFELSPINIWIMMDKIMKGDKKSNKLVKLIPDIWHTKAVSKCIDIIIKKNLYAISYDIAQCWRSKFAMFFNICNKYLPKSTVHYKNMFKKYVKLAQVNISKPDIKKLNKLKDFKTKYFEMLKDLQVYLNKVAKKLDKDTDYYSIHSYVLKSIPKFLKLDYRTIVRLIEKLNKGDTTWLIYMQDRDKNGSLYLTKLVNKFNYKIIVWNHIVHSYYNFRGNKKKYKTNKTLNLIYALNLKPLGYWFKKRGVKDVFVLAILHGKGKCQGVFHSPIENYVPQKDEFTYGLSLKNKKIYYNKELPNKVYRIMYDLFIPKKDFDAVYFIPKISMPTFI